MSRWGYAALNATHVFAVALLVGSILPLDARLLVEEPVHALSGSLGTVMIIGGAWRLRRADFGVERVLQPPREEHPRGH